MLASIVTVAKVTESLARHCSQTEIGILMLCFIFSEVELLLSLQCDRNFPKVREEFLILETLCWYLKFSQPRFVQLLIFETFQCKSCCLWKYINTLLLLEVALLVVIVRIITGLVVITNCSIIREQHASEISTFNFFVLNLYFYWKKTISISSSSRDFGKCFRVFFRCFWSVEHSQN